jgi:hypothetical protein
MSAAQKKSDDAAAQAAVEGRTPDQSGTVKRPPEQPPAGPHADPSLVNSAATPGTGALPPADGKEENMDSTSS